LARPVFTEPAEVAAVFDGMPSASNVTNCGQNQIGFGNDPLIGIFESEASEFVVWKNERQGLLTTGGIRLGVPERIRDGFPFERRRRRGRGLQLILRQGARVDADHAQAQLARDGRTVGVEQREDLLRAVVPVIEAGVDPPAHRRCHGGDEREE